MTTPADRVVERIILDRYHDHRSGRHSDIVCDHFVLDLLQQCPALAKDIDEVKVKYGFNIEVPGLTHKVDLMIYEVSEIDLEPSLDRARLCMENKSVITAHGKNRRNRHSDLSDFSRLLQARKPEAIVLGHVLVGTGLQYINIPDAVKSKCRILGIDFEGDVLPRLSSGDLSLWDEFGAKANSSDAAAKTVEMMRSLPVKEKGFTHESGFDFLLIEPVFIDNIRPPHVDRQNAFGIDVDESYKQMLSRACRAYTSRWHTLAG
jgi:hypothetical protein